jgi:hypothetical protein
VEAGWITAHGVGQGVEERVHGELSYTILRFKLNAFLYMCQV